MPRSKAQHSETLVIRFKGSEPTNNRQELNQHRGKYVKSRVSSDDVTFVLISSGVSISLKLVLKLIQQVAAG